MVRHVGYKLSMMVGYVCNKLVHDDPICQPRDRSLWSDLFATSSSTKIRSHMATSSSMMARLGSNILVHLRQILRFIGEQITMSGPEIDRPRWRVEACGVGYSTPTSVKCLTAHYRCCAENIATHSSPFCQNSLIYHSLLRLVYVIKNSVCLLLLLIYPYIFKLVTT